jgi:hypothetical protein
MTLPGLFSYLLRRKTGIRSAVRSNRLIDADVLLAGFAGLLSAFHRRR